MAIACKGQRSRLLRLRQRHLLSLLSKVRIVGAVREVLTSLKADDRPVFFPKRRNEFGGDWADLMAKRDVLRINFGVPVAYVFKPCPGVGEGDGRVHQGADHFEMKVRTYLSYGPVCAGIYRPALKEKTDELQPDVRIS